MTLPGNDLPANFDFPLPPGWRIMDVGYSNLRTSDWGMRLLNENTYQLTAYHVKPLLSEAYQAAKTEAELMPPPSYRKAPEPTLDLKLEDLGL